MNNKNQDNKKNDVSEAKEGNTPNNQTNIKEDLENSEDSTKLKKSSEDLKHQESLDLQEELSNLKEEKLRLLAEMENIRKRAEKEKTESIKFGSANLARDILSTNDNLTRALENVIKEKNLSEPVKNLIDGLKMVQKEFNSILEKHEVKKIDAINKKFDHNYHQAMLEVETNEVDEGIVVQEIQSGYTMHDRLLRPTFVGVSKKQDKNKKNLKK